MVVVHARADHIRCRFCDARIGVSARDTWESIRAHAAVHLRGCASITLDNRQIALEAIHFAVGVKEREQAAPRQK